MKDIREKNSSTFYTSVQSFCEFEANLNRKRKMPLNLTNAAAPLVQSVDEVQPNQPKKRKNDISDTTSKQSQTEKDKVEDSSIQLKSISHKA